MLKLIDDLLNRITMYRLVLYYLIFLLGAAVVLSFMHILSYNPYALLVSTAFLLAACALAFGLFIPWLGFYYDDWHFIYYATQGAQGDVWLAALSTSGGYTFPVFAPSTAQECYELTQQAFDWSERLRTPALVLAMLWFRLRDLL